MAHDSTYEIIKEITKEMIPTILIGAPFGNLINCQLNIHVFLEGSRCCQSKEAKLVCFMMRNSGNNLNKSQILALISGSIFKKVRSRSRRVRLKAFIDRER